MSRILVLTNKNVLEADYEKKVKNLKKNINKKQNILKQSGVTRDSVKQSLLMQECIGCKKSSKALKKEKKLEEINLILDTQLLMTQRSVKSFEKEIEKFKKQEAMFEKKFIRLYEKYNKLEQKYKKLLHVRA